MNQSTTTAAWVGGKSGRIKARCGSISTNMGKFYEVMTIISCADDRRFWQR